LYVFWCTFLTFFHPSSQIIDTVLIPSDFKCETSVVISAVPKNTTFFVSVTVTLPYTKAEFDQAKQDKYTAAMAATAGTIAANVVIESITEKRRRAGAVDVKTKVASSRHVPVVSHAGIHHDDQQSPLCGTLTRAHSYLFYRSLRAMPRASISLSQPLALAMPSRRN
jgi:hypothetical protein